MIDFMFELAKCIKLQNEVMEKQINSNKLQNEIATVQKELIETQTETISNLLKVIWSDITQVSQQKTAEPFRHNRCRRF